MIKNDQREILRYGSSMGCYLSFAQVYLEVACGIVHLSKKDEKVSMNTYMIYHALLWYDIQVMLITLSLMNMSIIE